MKKTVGLLGIAAMGAAIDPAAGYGGGITSPCIGMVEIPGGSFAAYIQLNLYRGFSKCL